MGLISEQERHDLDQIRHVRNECAHLKVAGGKSDHEVVFDQDSMVFDRDMAKARCGNLRFAHPSIIDPRARFIDAATTLLILLWIHTTTVKRQETFVIDVAKTKTTKAVSGVALQGLGAVRAKERARRQQMHRLLPVALQNAKQAEHEGEDKD